MLELYFEKIWTLPDKIIMIPTEQAAIITFSDPKGLFLKINNNKTLTLMSKSKYVCELQQSSRSYLDYWLGLI